MSKGEGTRQLIIERTAPVFNRKGYAGTTMADIMKASGLSKGGIYGSFSSKEEVMIAAFRYNYRVLHDQFTANLDALRSFREKLLAYPRHYKRYFQQLMIAGGCPIQNTAIEADDTLPMLKKMASEALDTWKHRLMCFLKDGIAAGEFTAGKIDPEQMALMIISAIEGAVMVSMLSGNTTEIGLVMDWVSQLITGLD